MSSSETEFRLGRFLAGAFVGLAVTWALLMTVMLIVDPLGATGGNSVCPAGAKTLEPLSTKSLIAQRLRPRTIVLGTSRVKLGFGREELAILGPGPAANLGINAAIPADFASLADDALAGGQLERAFIGVDFNTMHQPGAAGLGAQIAAAEFPALERWRRAFLSFEALDALPAAIGDCRPVLHPDGTPILEADDGSDGAVVPMDVDRAWLKSQLLTGPSNRAGFAARLEELRSLVAELRRHEVEVVLFSAPYQEDLVALFAETGRLRDFELFHAEIARLAREEDVGFVDLHSAAAIRELGLPPCPDGGIGCHYLDLTHFSPLVGERIARALARDGASEGLRRP